MDETTFPVDRIGAFVAGETGLREGRKLLRGLQEMELQIDELSPSSQELLRNALLRLYLESDFRERTFERFATSLLKLERAGSAADPR